MNFCDLSKFSNIFSTKYLYWLYVNNGKIKCFPVTTRQYFYLNKNLCYTVNCDRIYKNQPREHKPHLVTFQWIFLVVKEVSVFHEFWKNNNFKIKLYISDKIFVLFRTNKVLIEQKWIISMWLHEWFCRPGYIYSFCYYICKVVIMVWGRRHNCNWLIMKWLKCVLILKLLMPVF